MKYMRTIDFSQKIKTLLLVCSIKIVYLWKTVLTTPVLVFSLRLLFMTKSWRKQFLRQQRLQSFFPSDHSFRSKLKTMLLILIFNWNSSVFIYLANNSNVYLYFLNDVFSIVIKIEYFASFLQFFLVKKTKKKSEKLSLIKDNFTA